MDFGYLDPGSGSMILQVLAGGVAAVAVTAKLYWRRVKRVLHIGGAEDEQPRLEKASEADRA